MGNLSLNCSNPKKPRHPTFFHGILGWIEYTWEFIVLCVVAAQFLGGITEKWPLTLGLLITTILVSGSFMLANMCWLGPNYKKRKFLPIKTHCEKKDDTKVKCELTFNEKVCNDLKYHSDDEHFRISALAPCFVVIIYGIFIRYNGQSTFQPLPTVPNHDDIMGFVRMMGFHLMQMGIAGTILISAFRTHWCFLYTYWTELNRFQQDHFARKPLKEGETEKKDLYLEKEDHAFMAKELYSNV
jgi:hypothetical protein